ncbi:MAG: EamA family transporter, partial [Candidatus Micrarchaeota archaeon]|nr:EamA family transporter [Candidatus Micrarchaeota archaeon]
MATIPIDWYYLVALSAVLNATVSIIQKRALKREHATQYSLASSSLLAVASLAFLPFANLNITLLQLLLAISFGILGSVTLLIGTKVARHGNISSVTPLTNVLPVLFTAVLAYVFLSEQLSLLQGMCIIGIAAVTYVLLFRRSANPMKKDFDSGKYKSMLVANAIIGAIGGIIAKYLLVDINVFTFLIITQITVPIFLGLFNKVKYKGKKGPIETLSAYKGTFAVLIILIMALRILNYFALTVVPV